MSPPPSPPRNGTQHSGLEGETVAQPSRCRRARTVSLYPLESPAAGRGSGSRPAPGAGLGRRPQLQAPLRAPRCWHRPRLGQVQLAASRTRVSQPGPPRASLMQPTRWRAGAAPRTPAASATGHQCPAPGTGLPFSRSQPPWQGPARRCEPPPPQAPSLRLLPALPSRRLAAPPPSSDSVCALASAARAGTRPDGGGRLQSRSKQSPAFSRFPQPCRAQAASPLGGAVVLPRLRPPRSASLRSAWGPPPPPAPPRRRQRPVTPAAAVSLCRCLSSLGWSWAARRVSPGTRGAGRRGPSPADTAETLSAKGGGGVAEQLRRPSPLQTARTQTPPDARLPEPQRKHGRATGVGLMTHDRQCAERASQPPPDW